MPDYNIYLLWLLHVYASVYALESATKSASSTKGLEVKIVIKLNYSTGSGLPAASCSAFWYVIGFAVAS